jgi:protein-tyrosine phosphatase
MRVLIVCDGNICRSPLAAGYLRQRAGGSALHHLVIDSAGLLGIEGSPAAEHSIEVAREAGLDLTGHRSRGITPSDLTTADLVLAMTHRHIETLERRFPQGCRDRLLLRAFEAGPLPRGGAEDLADPVSGPIEGYRRAFAIIRLCVDHLVLHLRHAR